MLTRGVSQILIEKKKQNEEANEFAQTFFSASSVISLYAG